MRSLLHIIVSGILILFLASCTSVFDDVRAAWHYATNITPDVDLSPEEIKQFPYTAIYVRKGDDPRALVVLGYVDGQGENRLHNWISQQRETLVTRHGRIVKTDSLHPELIHITDIKNDPLICIQQSLKTSSQLSTCEHSWEHIRDIRRDNDFISLHAIAEFTIEGNVDLTLADGRQRSVLHVRESLSFSSSALGPAATRTNQYWLEPDGHVVKSIQYIMPGEAGFEIEQVKWVGRDEY